MGFELDIALFESLLVYLDLKWVIPNQIDCLEYWQGRFLQFSHTLRSSTHFVSGFLDLISRDQRAPLHSKSLTRFYHFNIVFLKFVGSSRSGKIGHDPQTQHKISRLWVEA